jgi:hypothetical protein
MVVPDRLADNITRRMRIACSMTKNTDTHPEYVILFILPLKLWLGESVLLLRHKCIMYHVYSVAAGLGYLSVELWPFPAWLMTDSLFNDNRQKQREVLQAASSQCQSDNHISHMDCSGVEIYSDIYNVL